MKEPDYTYLAVVTAPNAWHVGRLAPTGTAAVQVLATVVHESHARHIVDALTEKAARTRIREERWQPGKPTVRQFLDLSTAHLPEKVMTGLNSYESIVAYPTEQGALMWVPDDIDSLVEVEGLEPPPPEVLAIWRFAGELGCDYVLFDADAGTVDGLPTWEW